MLSSRLVNICYKLLLLSNVLLLLSCSDFFEPKHSPGSGLGFGKLEATFESIHRAIFVPKCIRCHSGSNAPHGIDLTSYEKLMDGNVFPPLVVPGDPGASSLYQSIVNNSMPKNSSPLVRAEKAIVYNWILSGALKFPGGDNGEEPPDDDEPPCGGDGEPCDDDEIEPPCEENEPCDE